MFWKVLLTPIVISRYLDSVDLSDKLEKLFDHYKKFIYSDRLNEVYFEFLSCFRKTLT